LSKEVPEFAKIISEKFNDLSFESLDEGGFQAYEWPLLSLFT
jgi:hypothetical protein